LNSHKTTDGDDSMSRTAQQFMEVWNTSAYYHDSF
jgi:hypothetical protein